MSDKRRLLAPIIMLTAGAIASITMFIMQYELGKMLGTLLLILVLFYLLGSVFSYVLSRFEAQNEAIRLAKEAEEGEVIEKEMDDEDSEKAFEADDMMGRFAGSDFYTEGQ